MVSNRARDLKRKEQMAQEAKAMKKRKSLPLLSQIMPTEGFRWQARGGAPFLSSHACRRVVGALRRYIGIKDPDVIAVQLTRMFRAACEVLKRDDFPEHPNAFWDVVAAKIPWMAEVGGDTLAAFALRIISARVAVRPIEGFHKAIGELDQAKEAWAADTDLARAIEIYVILIPFAHSYYPKENQDGDADDAGGAGGPSAKEPQVGSVIQDLWIPWWLIDPDNQGDEQSTIDYKKLVGRLGNMDIDATTSATTTSSQLPGDGKEEEEEYDGEDEEEHDEMDMDD